MNDCRIIIGTAVTKHGRRFALTKEIERRNGLLFARIRQRHLRKPQEVV